MSRKKFELFSAGSKNFYSNKKQKNQCYILNN